MENTPNGLTPQRGSENSRKETKENFNSNKNKSLPKIVKLRAKRET